MLTISIFFSGSNLMSNACLEDFIVEIPNLISKEECDAIINIFNDVDDHFKDPGRLIHVDEEGNHSLATNSGVKSGTDMDLTSSGSETCLGYAITIHEKLMKSMKYYEDIVTMKCPTFGEILHQVLSPNATVTAPILQCTGPGQQFKWHVDTCVKEKRFLAFILYLNNSEEFEGGYTDFLSRRVVPEAGKLLIFPAEDCMLHRGVVVERGLKYIITAFCNEKGVQLQT